MTNNEMKYQLHEKIGNTTYINYITEDDVIDILKENNINIEWLKNNEPIEVLNTKLRETKCNFYFTERHFQDGIYF